MKVNKWVMPILGAVLFFGSWGVGEVTGSWQTSGKTAVVAGQLTVGDLKGWMTIRQAAEGLGVPPADLLAVVGAPEGSGVTVDTAFKDLEALVPGFSLSDFRTKVTAWLDARKSGGTAIPSAAPTSRPSAPGASPQATSAAPAPTGSAGGTPTGTRTGTPTGTGTGTSSQTISGSMTLRQVADANGIALARLIAECGLPASTNPDLTLKTLKDTTGVEIQAVRDAVQRIKG